MDLKARRGAHRRRWSIPALSSVASNGAAALLGIVACLSIVADLVPRPVAVVAAVVAGVLTFVGQRGLGPGRAAPRQFGFPGGRRLAVAMSLALLGGVAVVVIVNREDDNVGRNVIASQSLTVTLPVALLSAGSDSPPGLTIEDDALYVYGLTSGAPVLAAFSLRDGRRLWITPLPGRPRGDPLVVPEGDVVVTQFWAGSQPFTAGFRRPDGRQMWTSQYIDARMSSERPNLQDRNTGYSTGSLLTALRPTSECCSTAVILDARTGSVVRTARKDGNALMLPLGATEPNGRKFVEWSHFSPSPDSSAAIRDVATGRKLVSRVFPPGYTGPPTVAGASMVWVVANTTPEHPYAIVATSIRDLTTQWSWTVPAIDRRAGRGGMTEQVESFPCASRVLCVHYFFLQDGRKIEGIAGLDLTNGRELWNQPGMATVVPVPDSDEVLLGEAGEGVRPHQPPESYVLANALTGSILRRFAGVAYAIDGGTVAILQSSGPGRLPGALAVESVRLADGSVNRRGTVTTQSDLCRFGSRKLVCPTARDKLQIYSFT